MEQEALCKKHTEDTQKLREEKNTLEGMVESHDELVMEIANEIGLNRMGEDADDEDKNDDDRGDIAAPPATAPPPVPMPPATAPEEIIVEGDLVEMVSE
jgi:hypothetical protein